MPAPNESDARWYVIKTARFKENYVGGQLAAIAGSESYLPLAKVPKQYLKRGQAQIEPLFPGYVFAHLDLTRQLMALRRVHAFHSLVSFDGQPAAVDPIIIDGLRRRERGRGYIPLPEHTVTLQPHDPVRVVEGPFQGLVGRFVRYEDSTARICLLMDILKPQALLKLPLSAVVADSRPPDIARVS